MTAFYARQATAHPEYADKMKTGEGELSRRAGLKPGAIVVGLDGKRVRTMDQYSYVRALTTSPDIDLLVYQDGKYQEIHANIPGRMFNLVFGSWP